MSDGQALAVFDHGAGRVSLLLQRVTDVIMAELKVPLPLDIGRILVGEGLGDGHALAVFGERPLQVFLRNQRCANFDVADLKVALPLGVGRILGGD